MLKKIFFTLLSVAVLTGCRGSRPHPERAGHPNDHAQKHKVTVSMGISEAAPPVPAKKIDKPHNNSKNKGKIDQRKVPAPRSGKQAEQSKNGSKGKNNKRPSEPSPRGIDRNLNSVEQQHLNEVRERNRQQQRDNERNVFGGFTDGLFKKRPE